MCCDTPQAGRHAKSERLELPRAESVLTERPHGAACLPAEGSRPAWHAAAGERWSDVDNRFARGGAQRPNGGHCAELVGGQRRPRSNRGARLRFVVIHARRPAHDELAAPPDEPVEHAPRALLGVARRRIRHAVLALQRDWQERIAVGRLGPCRVRESRNPDRVVSRTDVFNAPQDVHPAERQSHRRGALE